MWEAPEVPMFCFLTWMVFILQQFVKCTFPLYIVICMVAVFRDKSSHLPTNNTNTHQK